MDTNRLSWILYRPYLFTILATASVSAPLLISWSRYSVLLGTVPSDLALGLSFCLSIVVAFLFAGALSLAALISAPAWTVVFVFTVLIFGWFLGSNLNFLEYGAHWTGFDFTTLTSGFDFHTLTHSARDTGGSWLGGPWSSGRWHSKAIIVGAVSSVIICTICRSVTTEIKKLHRPSIRFAAFFFLSTGLLLGCCFWGLVNFWGAPLSLRKALELGTSTVQPMQWLAEQSSNYIEHVAFPICSEDLRKCASKAQSDRSAYPRLDRVVLIVSDALRADHIPQYGYARDTLPSLSQKASEVVVVPNYWSNGPHTLSALSTIMGSRYFALEDPDILERTRALWSHLKKNEVHTGFFSSVDTQWGFLEERIGIVSAGQTLVEERQTPALHPWTSNAKDRLATSFVRLPERFAADRLADFYKHTAHDPSFSLLYTQATYFPWILSSVKPHFLPTIPSGLTLKDLESLPQQQIVNAYDNAIFELNGLIERVANIQRASPEIPSVIVVTGDHGESLGEQGTFFHGSSMREEQIRVPLLFLFNSPELASAFREQLALPTRAASHVDITPTLLDFLAISPLAESQGISLLSSCTKTEEILSYTASADFLCSIDMKTRQKRVLNMSSLQMSTSNLLEPVHEGTFTFSSNQKLKILIPPRGCLPGLDSGSVSRR